jgi:putative transposase
MSRPIRIQYPGALYHITSRGNGRNKIYLNDKDYQAFLIIFAEVIKKFNWIVYAFCLMPNHYHLLIEIPSANLSQGMRQLNGVYTQKFNYLHNKVGHIFQGRFKSILAEKEGYVCELARYITLNPVRAKIADTPGKWKWSSHNEIIGKFKPTGCVDASKTLRLFHRSVPIAKKEYLDFINARMEKDIRGELKGGVLLGTIEFAKKASAFLKKHGNLDEIPVKERLVHRPALNKLFVDCDSKKKRNMLVYEACNKYAYSLSEVGRHLGLHYTTVSLIAKKVCMLKNKQKKTL